MDDPKNQTCETCQSYSISPNTPATGVEEVGRSSGTDLPVFNPIRGIERFLACEEHDRKVPRIAEPRTLIGAHQVLIARVGDKVWISLTREGAKPYNFPGGKCHRGEEPMTALFRELIEEGVDHYAHYDRVVTSEAPGVISWLYIKELHNLNPIRGARWFDVDEIERLVETGFVARYTLRHMASSGCVPPPYTVEKCVGCEQLLKEKEEIRQNVIDVMSDMKRVLCRIRSKSEYLSKQDITPLWGDMFSTLDKFLNSVEKR